MVQDGWSAVRFSLRRVTAAPGFALAVITTLAVGIAANATMFSLIDALVLRPLAGSRVDRIVAVFPSTDPNAPYRSSSYPDYVDVQELAGGALSDLAIFGMAPVDLRSDHSLRATAATVSGNYFQVLGVGAMLGRAFTRSDEAPASPPVALLGEKFWRNRFDSDPRVLGRTMRLNRQTYTVVGVIAHPYCSIRRVIEAEVFVPMSTRGGLTGEPLSRRTARQFFLIGRLAPGASVAQAQARMTVAAAALHRRNPVDWSSSSGGAGSIRVLAESAARVPPAARLGVLAFLTFLQGMMGLVLLIACGNLANLALARAMAQEREVAIRLAIGASRGRLLAELLTDSALLAASGCLAGLLLTRSLLQWLAGVDLRSEVAIFLDAQLDHRVFLFALALATVATLLFGVAPALQATRVRAIEVLRHAADPAGKRKFRVRRWVIVAEVAMSVVLLVPASLFVRSLRNVAGLDLGFDSSHLALLSVSLDWDRRGELSGTAVYDRMAAALRATPGVLEADIAAIVPLAGVINSRGWREAGSVEAPREIGYNLVGPAYFRAMGIGTRQGRAFEPSDGPATRPVAIVNEAFERMFWPGGSGLGKWIAAADQPATRIEIVGIVPTGKYENASEAPTPYLYRPIAQEPSPEGVFHVRTRGNPTTLLPALMTALQRADRTAAVFDPRTMERQLAFSIGPFRLLASSLVALGGVGLGLACVGLYGLMAFSTARRRNEIAIRLAIGALRGDVLRLLVGQGLRLVAIGLAMGLPMALGVGFLIASFLLRVAPTDPLSYLAVSGILTAVATAAVGIPAWRAAHGEPAAVLRSA